MEVEAPDKSEIFEWHCQFYFVAAARKDGSAPSIEKAVDGKFFIDLDEAEIFRKMVSQRIGYEYEVFEGKAVIPRFQKKAGLA